MLESRCVEDDVRLDFGDQRIDESGVPQVAEHQIIAGEQRRPLESELSGMEAGFVPVGHDQSSRIETCHLPTELGSDGPSGAGDEDDPPGDRRGDVLDVRGDRLATDEVLKADIAEAPRTKIRDRRGVRLLAAEIGFGERGQDLDLHGTPVETRCDALEVLRRQVGDGDDDDGRPGSVDLLGEFGNRSDHPDAVVAKVTFVRVVVEEPGSGVFVAAVLGDHVECPHALSPGTDDERGLR